MNKTLQRELVEKTASFTQKTLPAQTRDIAVKRLMQPARHKPVVLATAYQDFQKQVLVERGGKLEKHEIDCAKIAEQVATKSEATE